MKITSTCELCGGNTSRPISLCQACQDDFPFLENTCKLCSIELGSEPQINSNSICGQCLQSPPTVDYALSLFRYETPVDYLISQLKFKQQLPFAAIMGFLLKAHVLESTQEGIPDALLPVPLHKKRLIKRGFNQSLEISRSVAKEMKLPLLLDTVKRKKDTLMQTDLNASERRRNVKDCFEMKKVPEHQHIVIIDDVVTTGSTTNELARLLKNAGVKKVGVWSIARADFKAY